MCRAGPGVSRASPWARATPHLGATKMDKKNLYYTCQKKKKLYIYITEKKKKKLYICITGKKKKLYICITEKIYIYIHKIKFLLEGKKYIQKILGKNKKINQYTGGAKKIFRAKIKNDQNSLSN